jgi:nucleoside-diphosphate-sugar epimerase
MGTIVSPAELAAALREEIPGARVRIAERPKGMPTMNALLPSDISLARSALGFTPRYGIRESVRDLAAWLRGRQTVKAETLQ